MILKPFFQGRFIIFFVIGVLISAGPVVAQDASSDVLIERLNQIERKMRTIERAVYKDDSRHRDGKEILPSQDTLGAEKSKVTEGQLANAELRLSGIEEQIRSVTGQLEEALHAIEVLGGRFDKLVSDIDFRLQEIESRSVAPAEASDATETELTTSDTEVLPEGTPEERYNFVVSLLKKLDFEKAELALKAFLEAHPEDKLAGNAHYLLGFTYYSNDRLEEAAQAFLLGYRTFPEGDRSADTLLKLGITLRKMGQKDEACATFSELESNFPNPSAQILREMKAEINNTGCN